METASTKSRILDRASIVSKLRRMALQIAEQNVDEDRLVLAGINGNGEVVARSLERELSALMNRAPEVVTVRLNKKDPMDVRYEPLPSVEGRVVLLIDDVANTGKTMLYALKPLLEAHPKKIQTLVLVERSHKLFPIQTDYVGLSLATTLQEHIAVEVEGGELSGAVLY